MGCSFEYERRSSVANTSVQRRYLLYFSTLPKSQRAVLVVAFPSLYTSPLTLIHAKMGKLRSPTGILVADTAQNLRHAMQPLCSSTGSTPTAQSQA